MCLDDAGLASMSLLRHTLLVVEPPNQIIGDLFLQAGLDCDIACASTVVIELTSGLQVLADEIEFPDTCFRALRLESPSTHVLDG